MANPCYARNILFHRDLGVTGVDLGKLWGYWMYCGFVHVTPRRICACYTTPSSKYLDPLHVNKLLLGCIEHSQCSCVTSWLKWQLHHFKVGAACTKPQHIQLVGTLHFLKLSNFKCNDSCYM